MDTSPIETKKGVNMTTLELQKMAVEVRKGILTAVQRQNQVIRADPSLRQMCSHIFTLRK